jgi:alcohol dehydrogenase class IV
VDDVDRGVELARAAGADLVIGVGGGSAIDAAKAIAGLLTNGGQAVDYMEVVGKGLKITRPALPWIAVPTTAGTGAEVTRNAVIGLPEKSFKASIRSEHLLPRVAVIDPELGLTVPPNVTASSGMDALCQLIEAYTSTGANPMTDALAVEGIELAGRALRRAYANGADLDAREDMAMAALFSGIALTNAGLGAVHGFAAPVGAKFPVPHGVVCAALLPQVIQANVTAAGNAAAHEVLCRYAQIGRILTAQPNLDDEPAIQSCIAVAAGLVRDLKIPPLSRFGIGTADVPELVGLARKSSSMKYNPVKLSEDELARVLRRAITGAGIG